MVVFDHYCGVDVATKLWVHGTSTRAEISVGTEAVQRGAKAGWLLRLLCPGVSVPGSMDDGKCIRDMGSLDQTGMNVRRVAAAFT